MTGRIFIAAAFSLVYVSLYPILTGGFVIYIYPYWSRGAALAWVVGGILVQAWFCFGPATAAPKSSLLTQGGAGVLYAASIMPFSGGVLSKLSASWRAISARFQCSNHT